LAQAIAKHIPDSNDRPEKAVDELGRRIGFFDTAAIGLVFFQKEA